MLIAQLTDLHIKKAGKRAYRKVDTLKCLQNAVEHINNLKPMPDMVVVTGDLADFGESCEYEVIYPELAKLKPVLKVVPGNHDHRTHLREALGSIASFAEHEYCHFSEFAGGYQLIGLDTSVVGKPYGMLAQSSLEWLDNELAHCQDKPALLFMHHPPMAVGLSHMDVQKLLNDGELYQVLQRYSHVKGIVAGHLHRPIFATWQGLPVWVGPSHSHSVSLDLDPKAPSSFSLEPVAIQLFRLSPEGITSHISYIDDADGPYPFFDENNQLID